MNKGLKIGINVFLIAVVLFLALKLFSNIMAPIHFKNNFNERTNVVKDKMMKIREVEMAYLDTYGKYSANFDTLLNFVKNDSIIVIKSVGTVPDSIYLTAKTRKEAELKALELGIISRDTIKISVRDSLFKNLNCDTLQFIPYTDLTEVFQLQAGFIKTLSQSERPVFELKAHNNSFSKGLKEQLVINLNDAARDNEEFPGLIVGSMTEVTTAGNWD
ncbi:MAG: hypothetical protein JXL97_08675 [Bacteroidales bacterium]|nr:hypothetical protein [Bacteroidales bacterium]